MCLVFKIFWEFKCYKNVDMTIFHKSLEITHDILFLIGTGCPGLCPN